MEFKELIASSDTVDVYKCGDMAVQLVKVKPSQDQRAV